MVQMWAGRARRSRRRCGGAAPRPCCRGRPELSGSRLSANPSALTQTNKQTNKQTKKQPDRQTDRQAKKHAHKHTNRRPSQAARPGRALSAPARQPPGPLTHATARVAACAAIAAAAAARTEMQCGLHMVRVRLCALCSRCEQTNKQTVEQTNKQTNKRTSKQTNIQTNERANKQTYKQTNERASGGSMLPSGEDGSGSIPGQCRSKPLRKRETGAHSHLGPSPLRPIPTKAHPHLGHSPLRPET